MGLGASARALTLNAPPSAFAEPNSVLQVNHQASAYRHTSDRHMDQPRVWGPSRYVTLLAVLALHVALLAVLVMASGGRPISASTEAPVELLLLPPAKVPKISSENSRPRRLSAYTALAVEPPVLDAAAPASLPPASASEGSGSGVDWAAEARRALQAHEIRTHQPPSNTLSGSPAEDNWWPRARHSAGNSFKTATGDWIVWINARCYQVANSTTSVYALGSMLSHTICLEESRPPRGNSSDPPPADPGRDTQY
jgi:hypothetical protein